jgi:hypothetical protein
LKTYSPGLISGIFLLFVVVFVNSVLIKNFLIQAPYYALILLFIKPALNTLKVKNEMTPEIRRVHNLFVSIEDKLRNINNHPSPG